MLVRWIAVLGLAACSAGVARAQGPWKPAPAPLMTKWAADVKPEAPLPEYPRPQMVRKEWLNLNGLWQFAPAAEGEKPPFGKELPGRILVPFPVESALSGVGERHERVWYRFRLQVPKAWRTPNQRILLHFGAVDFETTVYVNGNLLGRHRGGYDPFTLDITDNLWPEKADDELIVGVYDPADGGTQPRGKQMRTPEGIWYTPTTGIWQTVWLEPIPRQGRIEALQITPDASSGRVILRARTSSFTTPERERLTYIIYENDKEVARADGGGWESISIDIPHPRLWTPEDPYLYGLTVMSEAGGTSDAITSYFALRDVSLGKDESGRTRIMLNGKPYFGVGLLDQGFWPDGIYTAPTDEALRYDLEQTKALGFNLIRKHVKVEPQRWYYHADQLGLLVWQDMPSGDAYIGGDDPDITRTPESAAEYETELKAMIENLRNHPCIVMWVPYNEGWGQWDTGRIVTWIKDLDPTRLVDSASGWTDRGVGDVHDIHVYPGPGSPQPEEHRAAVLGEFGGLGLGVDGHTWAKKTWGYQGMADRDALTDRYVELLRRCYELRDDPGLSAVIYTQTTDVETECNGLMTYDRAVVKMDAKRVAAANRGQFPKVSTLVPTAEREAVQWLYSFQNPGEGWMKPAAGADLPAGPWKRAPGGFGTNGTPGAVVRTVWDGAEIWIRRSFVLSAAAKNPRLLIHHDENAEVYINGVLAATLDGYTTGYELVRIAPEAAATIRPGANTIAVHCRQTRGGQYIDAGLAEVGEP